MAKNFNDFLPVHHLFDITFDLTYRTLLSHEIFRASAAYRFSDKQYGDNADDDYRPKQYAVIKHNHRQSYERYYRGTELRKTLRNELTKRVYIVRVNTHYIAVRVTIEVFNRQFFHFVEYFVSQIAKETLRNNRSDLSESSGGNPPDTVNNYHRDNDFHDLRHRFVDGSLCFGYVLYLNVNILQEHARYRTADRAYDERNHYGKQHRLIIFEEHANNAPYNFESAFLCRRSSYGFSHSYSLPPSAEAVLF